MADQQTFAGEAWKRKGKVERRERFLAEMDAVIPWSRLLALIDPYDRQAKTGRVPHDLERMLRTYFLQQWFNLSDPHCRVPSWARVQGFPRRSPSAIRGQAQ